MTKGSNRLTEIIEDTRIAEKIRNRLPYLFQIAEQESSRAGRVGMEVGVLREKIIIALLIHVFGENNVETEIPTTEPEMDVKVFGRPISIKTITGSGGVKAIWTVDATKALEFCKNYQPKAEMLLVRVKWNGIGKFYYIPLQVQKDVLAKIGSDRYFKRPKQGTNPRGVEFSKEALTNLCDHPKTKSIEISWQRSETKYNVYKRWVEYWKLNRIDNPP